LKHKILTEDEKAMLDASRGPGAQKAMDLLVRYAHGRRTVRRRHGYYIPLSCMTPKDADNIVTAGRSVDGDSEVLSAVRVIGPCIAMGAAAAAYALDLAELGKRLSFNLDRTD
jgi:hypothetical protein